MTIDEQHMRKALELARAGVGLVSPNPAVGAVIVNASGREVGTGTHTYAGVKHAEVLALEQAGSQARGATLYLNLEPCSHHGRTGPCADAVISAGISRVVCSMEDPNPKVAGRGFAKLRAAGIQVDVGMFETEAKKLNESFAKYIRFSKPLVTLKSAMSLDGKIAAAATPIKDTPVKDARINDACSRRWITGEAARAHVQQLRHQNDAILVGVGTVIADDPLLTDRSSLPRRRNLLRVILDSDLRIPLESQVIRTAEDDVLIICSTPTDHARRALEARGIRVQQISSVSSPQISSSNGGRPDFAAIVKYLGEIEITSVLIEGGSSVNATALQSGEVDRVFLYYAPKLLGEGAIPFIAAQDAPWQARCLQQIEVHRFGEDFAVEGYLRDPYSPSPSRL
jgi:diaminohydroxyphosphoribosylaminopyrimidine deaminase / 5-amino-6-(5-phosphoribosylamino)uracil reductase